MYKKISDCVYIQEALQGVLYLRLRCGADHPFSPCKEPKWLQDRLAYRMQRLRPKQTKKDIPT
jgi:hypothetical protein